MLRMELSPENDNFIKLSRILVDVVARYLREYFVKLWDENYPEKWHDDVTERNITLQKLLVKKDGKKKDDIYSQKILKGDEHEWDITTSIKAILDSGFKLMEGCRPQDQRTVPLRASEEIEIIRGIRNTYYGHLSSTTCTLDEFIDIMIKVNSTVKNLFGIDAEREIYRIQLSSITPSMRNEMKKILDGIPLLFAYLFNSHSQ